MTTDAPETAPAPRGALRRSVVLVGLMGAGKSTIGRRLAHEIGAPFWDSDDEIARAADMTIPDIFETYGEAHFRDRERRVIQRLLDDGPGVLATGGGAFVDDESRALMLQDGHVLWLRADLETLVSRCSRRDDRPLLRNGDMRETLAALIKTRYPIYAEAHSVVESVDGPHENVVSRALRTLRAAGVVA